MPPLLDALVYGVRHVLDRDGNLQPTKSRVKFDAAVEYDDVNDWLFVSGFAAGTATAGPTIENGATGTLNDVYTLDTDGVTKAGSIYFTGAAPSATGLAGGVEGREITLLAGPSTTLTLQHDVGSLSGDRFFLPGSAPLTIGPNGTARAVWNVDRGGWQMIADQGGGVELPIAVGTGTAPTTGSLARISSGSYITGEDLVTINDGSTDHTILSSDPVNGYAFVLGDSATDWRMIGNFISVTSGTGGIAFTSSASNSLSSNVFSVSGYNAINLNALAVYLRTHWALGGSPGSITWPDVGSPYGAIATSSVPSAKPSGNTWVWFWNGGNVLGLWTYDNDVMRWGGRAGAGATNYASSIRATPGLQTTPVAETRMGEGYAESRTFFGVVRTSSTTTTIIMRYEMANETVCAFSYKITMARRTSTTKAGTYQGQVAYKRTAGAGPVVFGVDPADTEEETTAGDGITIVVATNEVQFKVTAADTDPRNWFCELHVHEVSNA